MDKKSFILIVIILAVFSIFMGITDYILFFKQPTINNTYNIEHVDTLVIPDINEEPNINNTLNELYPKYEKIYLSDFYKQSYEVDDTFKFINCKINNWIVKEEYQRILYNVCKKYNINFIQALAIMYKEASYNNQFAMNNKNSNGYNDIGLMQVNSFNTDVLYKIAKTNDVNILYDPAVNINCACYIIWRNEKYDKYCGESMFDSIMAYNGGLGTLKKFKSGEYTDNCHAYKYATDVVNIMNQLNDWYKENI